ncbi:MAG: class I SAM-dependent methyltransferase [Pseudomonadota bacterium]
MKPPSSGQISQAAAPNNTQVEPHGALMDGVYRKQRHIYDLTRKYYLLGRDRLLTDLAPQPGETVLEIACGTGRNLARARGLFPQVKMAGLDISAEMLKSAEQTLAQDIATGHVSLRLGDACRFDPVMLFDQQSFDHIFISYGLSMIPDWRGAIYQAVDVLAPGGTLHIVDFGQQEQLPRWFRAGLHRWLGKFHVTPRVELQEAVHAVSASVGGTATVTSLYRDYARLAKIERPRDA